MAETFIGYKVRFEKAWRPYWSKWLKRGVLRTKTYHYDDPKTGHTHYVHAYAGIFHEHDAPEPEELAQELDRLLGWLMVYGGGAQIAAWMKPEGELARHISYRLGVPPDPEDGRKLIVRKPFEAVIGSNFETREQKLSIYGRFGVWEER